MRKILITGGNGFVGSHVYDKLSDWEDCFVHAPTRAELNILHAGLLEQYIQELSIDCIVHLAATCGGIGINKDQPGRFFYENMQMGINVVEAARKTNCKLVNLGTVCSYPKHTPVPFKEVDLWNGYPEETNAPYGIAKKATMEMTIAYARQYGLQAVNLMPTNMAGPGDNFDYYSSHVIPALIRKFEEVKDDQPIVVWGTGSASREFLDVRDCARAVLAAVQKDCGPEPMNVGSGIEITIRELVELIKNIGGYSNQVKWDAQLPDGQPRRCLDSSKAREALNWSPVYDLRETIADTIEWYREEVAK